MNKEQQELLDEVYDGYAAHTILGIESGLDRIAGHLDNCLVEYDGYYEHFTNPSFAYGYRTYNQEEFINKCKTDTEFSERWGLKIEERELSLKERLNLISTVIGEEKIRTHEDNLARVDKLNIPTKLITITYNDKTIESYE